MLARGDALVGSAREVAVVIVCVPGWIAVFATTVVVGAVRPVEGKDVVLDYIISATTPEEHDAHAVENADIVEHLVVVARQDDPCGLVGKADVPGDALPLRVAV